MRILIIEDEAVAARGIERMLRDLLGSRIESLRIQKSLTAGEMFIEDNPLDLLFLDLNLNGQDGFEILQNATAGSFQTIVISANTDRAIEAFHYGVLDFVPKPLDPERMRKALERYDNATGGAAEPMRYLSVRSEDTLKLLPLEEILYLEGSDNDVIIHLRDGSCERHRKTLHSLEKVIPSHFVRIHKSYILDRREIRNFRIRTGGKYEAELRNGAILPVSRSRYRELAETGRPE